ncbi:MAG: SDR family oxidoreductase [Desulfobacterales bacterium]|nr:SDR family oxidoreductase [Desulfobacterales bacterium]MBF0396920.1 SDR family oxidoreductase [Desulfobacterales bacterium]
MKINFSGKRILILGGTCELALYLSKSLIDSGLFPILTFRSSSGKSLIHDYLKNFNGKYEAIYFDLGNKALIDNINNDLDYLVDFAQSNLEDLIAFAEHDDVANFFFENVSVRAEVLKNISRVMLLKKRGRMIFISSSAAVRINSGQGFYSAAKLACEAIYRSIGIELGSRGITTVTLRLGYIDSGRGKEYLKDKNQEVIKMIPIERLLNIEEVSATILFLLSDNAFSLNATEIVMDGGLCAKK